MNTTMTLVTAVVIFAICCTVRSTEAWSIVRQQQGRSIESIQLVDSLQRRNVVSSIIGTTATALGITTSLIIAVPNRVQAAAPTSQKVTDAINELKESRDKLKDIPDLLEAKEWDKVRSILKVPPVNKLWNLGDSQNTVLVLAKETGNIDLFELKEDLAYNLQICDQLTYDNAFVYYQPGNGKFKIKEPQQLSVMAMKQIQQIIDIVAEQ